MTVPFRLISDIARPPAINMALDEALTRIQERSRDARPTLRFYTWDRPALSIGYFQSVPGVVKRFRCQEEGLCVVRRATGGGLVRHGDDLTFSITLRRDSGLLPEDVKASYLRVNEALRKGLAAFYPALDYADCRQAPSGRASGERVCFESPSCYDLLIGKRKVVGASQRRRGDAVLHQSSVFLEGARDSLIGALREGFEKVWGVRFETIGWREDEIALAREIERERYESDEWSFEPAGMLNR